MRFFVSKRLPGGFRAGLSVPVGVSQRSAPRATVSAVPADACYCYVIRSADGLVKIGTSTNVAARLRALQTSSPHRLELLHAFLVTDNGARELEGEAHRLLDRHRCHGEWFDVTADAAVQAVEQAGRNVFGKSVVDLTGEARPQIAAPAQPRGLGALSDAALAAIVFTVIAIFVTVVVIAARV
jgi:hypothetical protein